MFAERLERVIFYLLILFLPTQLGKHFWPDFAIVSGIRVDYLSPTLYVTDILVGLLFTSWTIGKIQSTKLKVQSFKLPIFLLAFLLFNIYLSQNYLNGLYHMLKLLEFSFVGYYVATTIKTHFQIKKLFLALSIGVIGQSLLAITQFINQGSLGGIFYFFGERLFTASTPGIANASISGELILRPYATFSHPNVLAGFLLVSMICLFFTLPWTRNYEKTIWIASLLLGSSALLLTMSRVAFVLWLGLLLAVFIRHVAVRSVRIVISIILLAAITFFAFGTPFGSRFYQTSPSEEAFVQRVELTRASIELTTSQPIVGVGIGNFLPMLATITSPLPLNLYLQPVHNIFLLVLVETGIVGMGIFIWFLVKTYKRLFRVIKKEQVLPYRLFIILLTVVLILGSFDHYLLTLQQGQLLFSLILGVCWTKLQK